MNNMNKLNCEVGEIWLNDKNAQVEIIYVDHYNIVGKIGGHVLVYAVNGEASLEHGTQINLSKKKPRIETKTIYIPLWRLEKNIYSFGAGRYEKNPVTETYSDFVKWIETEVELEIDD